MRYKGNRFRTSLNIPNTRRDVTGIRLDISSRNGHIFDDIQCIVHRDGLLHGKRLVYGDVCIPEVGEVRILAV